MKLTKEQKKDYLKVSGNHCPYCRSHDICGDHVEVNDGGAWQEVVCMECERRWTDIYKLIDIEVEA